MGLLRGRLGNDAFELAQVIQGVAGHGLDDFAEAAGAPLRMGVRVVGGGGEKFGEDVAETGGGCSYYVKGFAIADEFGVGVHTETLASRDGVGARLTVRSVDFLGTTKNQASAQPESQHWPPRTSLDRTLCELSYH